MQVTFNHEHHQQKQQQKQNKRHPKKGRGGGGNNPLVISSPPPKQSQFDVLTKTVLKVFLKTRWNAEAKMLNLSQMKDSSDLREVSPDFNALAFCTKLFNVIGEIYVPMRLESISFSDNSITTLRHICTGLKNCEASVKNICLSKNKVSMLTEIDYLKPLNLREVMLNDNPIATHVEYVKHTVRKLSTVEMLDQVSVMQIRQELLPKLPPVAGGHKDDGLDMLGNFAAKYFKELDARQSETLLDAYDTNAIFSFTVDGSVTIPSLPRATNLFSFLLKNSHNIKTAQCRASPTQGLRKGRLKIVTFLLSLIFPAGFTTLHDSLAVDMKCLGQKLIATIHGKLTLRATSSGSSSSGGKNSNLTSTFCFDRTWILNPNTGGGEWPLSIMNDVFHLRSDSSNVMVGPSQNAPTPATPANPAPTTTTTTTTEMQMIQAVQQATGMTAERCKELLINTGGDVQASLKKFSEMKDNIPKEYFAQR
eukprot:TRINITY_DN21367_c0_g1_i1.p1 TRINITY_DN21367_c0_g1~~TRINITY_DN21367_c0_g1_i1.p1  ORF type:complete len:513 (-),score=55.87 TRINITY_DN21367_c0_g1_i1:81-1514(-)